MTKITVKDIQNLSYSKERRRVISYKQYEKVKQENEQLKELNEKLWKKLEKLQNGK